MLKSPTSWRHTEKNKSNHDVRSASGSPDENSLADLAVFFLGLRKPYNLKEKYR